MARHCMRMRRCSAEERGDLDVARDRVREALREVLGAYDHGRLSSRA